MVKIKELEERLSQSFLATMKALKNDTDSEAAKMKAIAEKSLQVTW